MSLKNWITKREDRPRDMTRSHPLAQLREEFDSLFDRFFGDSWLTGFGESPGGRANGPRMDMAESEKDLTLKFDLPGVSPEDVDISITGNVLTIRGERREEMEEKRDDCCYSERSGGSFFRSIQLGSAVDPEKVDAKFKNGVLTVRVAKHPDAAPKKITVRQE